MSYLNNKEIVARQEGTHQFDRLLYNMKQSPGFLPTEYVDVTVSSDEILALNATPKTVVSAPGAGLVTIFQGAFLFLDYNSAAYAGIAADEDLSFKYTDDSGLEVGACEATGFLDQTADQIRYTPVKATAAITPVANAALVLHMATGEITTGDSPLYVRVFYSVIPASLPYVG